MVSFAPHNDLSRFELLRVSIFIDIFDENLDFESNAAKGAAFVDERRNARTSSRCGLLARL